MTMFLDWRTAPIELYICSTICFVCYGFIRDMSLAHGLVNPVARKNWFGWHVAPFVRRLRNVRCTPTSEYASYMRTWSKMHKRHPGVQLFRMIKYTLYRLLLRMFFRLVFGIVRRNRARNGGDQVASLHTVSSTLPSVLLTIPISLAYQLLRVHLRCLTAVHRVFYEYII